MTTALHVVPFGDDALLVEVADLAAVRRLDDALRRAREGAGGRTDATAGAADRGSAAGAADRGSGDTSGGSSVWRTVVDQVPAATTVLLRTAPGADLAALAAAVRRVGSDAGAVDVAGGAAATEVVELPAVYDGADLAEVAAMTGLTVDEVVERHSAATYTVAFGGFMPGFAYLVGLDPVLRVPRRATPRERVPRGALAVADEFTAVYPAATPGGWRLLGRCDVPLFDVTRTPPALLTPGTRVRFVRAPAPEPDA